MNRFNPEENIESQRLKALLGFQTKEGKELLKSLGIKGDYVGIGHCVLGYVDGEYPEIPERKPNWVYNID